MFFETRLTQYERLWEFFVLLPVLLCFWQLQSDPIRPSEQARLQAAVRTDSFEQEKTQEIQLRKRDFERRFNDLIDAIKNFSEDYNHSAGSAWPAKKADALRRAMHKLEQTNQLGGKN